MTAVAGQVRRGREDKEKANVPCPRGTPKPMLAAAGLRQGLAATGTLLVTVAVAARGERASGFQMLRRINECECNRAVANVKS